jgi:predicted transcriptional regulator
MELQAFEHYDYLMFMFKDIRDWLRVLQLLKVAKVDFSISVIKYPSLVSHP